MRGHQCQSEDIFLVKLGTETNTSPSRNAYMKPAVCSVLQEVLGANLAKETSGLQQILLKAKFKTYQLPSPPNLPDASHKGHLASWSAAIAMPQEPRLLSLCCCCFFMFLSFHHPPEPTRDEAVEPQETGAAWLKASKIT